MGWAEPWTAADVVCVRGKESEREGGRERERKSEEDVWLRGWGSAAQRPARATGAARREVRRGMSRGGWRPAFPPGLEPSAAPLAGPGPDGAELDFDS